MAIASFFIFFFVRFGWAWFIGGLMLLFGGSNRVVLAIGMGLVIFSVLASIIESVRVFFSMNSKKMQDLFPDNMDETIEKYNDEIFEMPEALPGRRCVERLREILNDSSTIEECVSAFEKECKEPFDEEMLLFECGTYSWNKGKFSFALTRQFPDGQDEFFHVTMELLFDPDDTNKKLFDSAWDDHIKGDFFDYVRRSKSYHYAQENKAIKVRIYMSQT